MERLAKWHQTKPGLGVFAVLELAVAYGFASLAVDRGTPIWYLLAFILLIGGLRNLAKLIGKLIHGHKTTEA